MKIRVGEQYVVGRLADGRPIVRCIGRSVAGATHVVDSDGQAWPVKDVRCCPPIYRFKLNNRFVIRKPSADYHNISFVWTPVMDALDGKPVKLKRSHGFSGRDYIIAEGFYISRDWLIPI